MNEWMDEQMNGWMDGWMYRWWMDDGWISDTLIIGFGKMIIGQF